MPAGGLGAAARIDLDAGLRGGRSYLFELECLRGIAIILVFLFHAWGISGLEAGQSPGVLESFIIAGSTGVTLFFVLSGFLLVLPWLDRSGKKPGIRNYLVARVLRVVPLYYATVLVGILATGKWQQGMQAAAFQFIGFDMFPFSVVWWTLVTEVQFYLVLPLIGLALWNRGLWLMLLYVCVAFWLALYLWMFVVNPNPENVFSYWTTKSLFGRLPAFLLGVALALVYRRYGYHRTNHTRATAVHKLTGTLLLLLLLSSLGLILQRVAELGDWVAEWSWHLHHTYEAMCWTAILGLLLMGSFYGKQLLINRPMAIMGKLSYSFYVVHVPVLYYLISPAKETAGVAVYTSSPMLPLLPLAAFVLCLALSYVTYNVIELPFLRLKRRIAL